MTTPHADRLLARIRAHDALVGIIGLGYVGLPLALAFVEKGFPVLGFDVDPEKVAKLNRGEGYIQHLDHGRIAAARATGKLEATADFSRLAEPDAILICVPTSLTPQREPDMTYVDAAAHQIRATLRPGQLVILESTTYPGTTDERLRSILEGTPCAAVPSSSLVGAGLVPVPSSSLVGAGLAPARSSPVEGGHEPRPYEKPDPRAAEPAPHASLSLRASVASEAISSLPHAPRSGADFFLAFSPEREDPGRKDFTTTTTPKVVGGVDEISGDLAQALYDQIIAATVRVSSARAAEATKLMENIFRAVNIALVARFSSYRWSSFTGRVTTLRFNSINRIALRSTLARGSCQMPGGVRICVPNSSQPVPRRACLVECDRGVEVKRSNRFALRSNGGSAVWPAIVAASSTQAACLPLAMSGRI